MNLTKKVDNIPQLTEKEYRAVALDSYSSLKVYAESPMKFYKTFITKEIKREPESKDSILGSMVHGLLASPDGTLDEEKFLVGTISEIDKDANHPSYFAWKIWELTDTDIQANGGHQTRSFTSIAEEAFTLTKWDRNGNEVRFKKKELAYALEKFEGNLELWYKQKRSAYGRILVDIDDVNNAEKIVNDLKSYKDTSWIYTLQNNDRYEVYREMPIMFQCGDMKLKMMADEIIVDHQSKTVTPYDTKNGWEESLSRKYLDSWLYLQGATYDKGLESWQKDQGIENYKREPMQFIRVHSLSWYKPVIFPMTEQDLRAAINGFTTKWGKVYPGLTEITTDLQWSLETGNWQARRGDIQNNSRRPLSIPYA